MENWRGIQRQYIEEIESVFPYTPITRIPWYAEEVRGLPAVERLSRDLPDDEELFDPWSGVPLEERSAAFYGAESYKKTEDGYCLQVRVPGAESAELTVQLHGLDLDIRAGNVLRRIPLPNTLRGAAIRETAVREGILYVFFSEQVSGRT